MARSASLHILKSLIWLSSNCLQRQSGWCCFVEKSGPPQRLQAYRCSISLCSGLRHFREDRPWEDIYGRQCRRCVNQVSFGRSFSIPQTTHGRNGKTVRLDRTLRHCFGYQPLVGRNLVLICIAYSFRLQISGVYTHYGGVLNTSF